MEMYVAKIFSIVEPCIVEISRTNVDKTKFITVRYCQHTNCFLASPCFILLYA